MMDLFLKFYLNKLMKICELVQHAFEGHRAETKVFKQLLHLKGFRFLCTTLMWLYKMQQIKCCCELSQHAV